MTALGEVSRALSSTLDLEVVLQTIVSRASQLAGADGCAIYEYQEGVEEFQVRATHNFEASFVEALRAMPSVQGGRGDGPGHAGARAVANSRHQRARSV